MTKWNKEGDERNRRKEGKKERRIHGRVNPELYLCTQNTVMAAVSV
jgi:hypothetical protein